MRCNPLVHAMHLHVILGSGSLTASPIPLVSSAARRKKMLVFFTLKLMLPQEPRVMFYTRYSTHANNLFLVTLGASTEPLAYAVIYF